MKFQEQLLRALESRKWTRTDLAREIGASKSSTSNWCNGKSVPEREMLEKIATALGVTPAWLLYGDRDLEPPPFKAEQGNPAFFISNEKAEKDPFGSALSIETLANTLEIPPIHLLKERGRPLTHSLQLSTEITSVPLVPYKVDEDEPSTLICMVRLPSAIFRKFNPIQGLQHLEFVLVSFDSMEKALPIGSMVLLDKSCTSFTGAGVYAFKYSGRKYIRRIQATAHNKYKIVADDVYDPVEINEDEIQFIARAVMALTLNSL